MANSAHMTEEEIRKALGIAVRLVESYGNEFMPAVNRLVTELEKIKADDKILARAQWLLADPYLEDGGAS